MRILIFGAGALGSYFGALLSKDQDVVLLGRKEHMQAIRDDGLRITGKTEGKFQPETHWELNRLQSNEDGEFDLVILTVKSFDTENALKELLEIVPNVRALLSLQNGVNNCDILSREIRDLPLLAGVTNLGVTFLGPGKIHHAGEGPTRLGSWNGVNNNLSKEISAIFTNAGISTEATLGIKGEIWAKGVINAGINPLTGILGVNNGTLVSLPELKELMIQISSECLQILHAANIELPDRDLIGEGIAVAQRTRENKSSMLQDIEMGHPTEIDSINGAFVRLAEEVGQRAPLNQTLTRLIKAMETLHA